MLYVRLYVSDLAHYRALNVAYASLMRSTPAARACVQLPLHEAAAGARVALEVLAAAPPKRLLRVCSLSEWAPRMIGPYCQLTAAAGVGNVAGQLGLVPTTMALVEGGALAQARLALRHSEAVLSGLGLGTRRPLSLIAYVVRESDVVQVHAACHAWLWRRCGGGGAPLPPLLVLRVGALPMGALVEVQLEAGEEGAGGEAVPARAAEWEEEAQSLTFRCTAVSDPLPPRREPDSGEPELSGGGRRILLQCVAEPKGVCGTH